MIRAFFCSISILCFLVQAENKPFLSINQTDISQFFNTQILTQKDLSKTLILLDVDDTLITHKPGTWLGSSKHFYGLVDMLVNEKQYSKQQAITAIDSLLIEVYRRNPALLTDPDIPATMKKLSAKGAIVIGCTARGTIVLPVTLDQLNLVGIQFSPINSSKLFLKNGLFTVGQSMSKGEAAKALLTELKARDIEQIIFLDDKQKHLASVQQALKYHTGLTQATYGHILTPPPSIAFNIHQANKELCAFIEEYQNESGFKEFFRKNAFTQDFWRDCNKSYSVPSSDKY